LPPPRRRNSLKLSDDTKPAKWGRV